MGILNRIKGMMLDPQAEWSAVARDMPGARVLLRGFLLPLSLLAPAATMVGMLVFDTGWNGEYGYSMLAMLYSFYLYYLGAERLIGIRPADSAMFIGVAMVSMMVLSSVMGGIASALGIL